VKINIISGVLVLVDVGVLSNLKMQFNRETILIKKF